MKIELTHEIIEALDVDAAKLILKQLATDLKTTVDKRIDKIKTEQNIAPKKEITDAIIAEIQDKYDNGDRSLLAICNEDYPEYSYRSIWGKIKKK